MEYPEKFEILWKMYPKRVPNNPKRGAYEKYNARLKEGVLYSDLQAAVLRYYNYCRKKDKINTEFVYQMQTFLGVKVAGWEEDWEVPTVEVEEHWKDKAKRLGMTAQKGDTWADFEQKVRQAR